MHEHATGPLFALLAVDHCDTLNSCPEDEPMAASEECLDAATDESLLETNPIQSPLQVFAGMGGLALIAERLPMLYPDVIQQVRHAWTVKVRFINIEIEIKPFTSIYVFTRELTSLVSLVTFVWV